MQIRLTTFTPTGRNSLILLLKWFLILEPFYSINKLMSKETYIVITSISVYFIKKKRKEEDTLNKTFYSTLR